MDKGATEIPRQRLRGLPQIPQRVSWSMLVCSFPLLPSTSHPIHEGSAECLL